MKSILLYSFSMNDRSLDSVLFVSNTKNFIFFSILDDCVRGVCFFCFNLSHRDSQLKFFSFHISNSPLILSCFCLPTLLCFGIPWNRGPSSEQKPLILFFLPSSALQAHLHPIMPILLLNFQMHTFNPLNQLLCIIFLQVSIWLIHILLWFT